MLWQVQCTHIVAQIITQMLCNSEIHIQEIQGGHDKQESANSLSSQKENRFVVSEQFFKSKGRVNVMSNPVLLTNSNSNRRLWCKRNIRMGCNVRHESVS